MDTDRARGHHTTTITATDGHPFWTPTNNHHTTTGHWTNAKDLHPGTRLRTPTSHTTTILTTDHHTQTTTVHNLTIADLHTYYVEAGNTPVLVHNCGPGYDPEFPSIKLGNYRGRFNAWLNKNGLKRLPDDWDAHHAIPQEYRDHPEFSDFDFDAPSIMRGVPGSRMGSRGANVHQDITNQWAWFRAFNPNATRADIEGFAANIDRGYGAYWWAEPK